MLLCLEHSKTTSYKPSHHSSDSTSTASTKSRVNLVFILPYVPSMWLQLQQNTAPWQNGRLGKELQVRFGWHVTFASPINSNPGSHVYTTVIGNWISCVDIAPSDGGSNAGMHNTPARRQTGKRQCWKINNSMNKILAHRTLIRCGELHTALEKPLKNTSSLLQSQIHCLPYKADLYLGRTLSQNLKHLGWYFMAAWPIWLLIGSYDRKSKLTERR